MLRSQGYTWIAGVDEVGRGCLAGPVYAAAVVLPEDFSLPNINDSKKLTALQREKMYGLIVEQAVAYQIAAVTAEEIDRVNIFQASKQAMTLSLEAMGQDFDMVMVDGKFPLSVPWPQRTYVGGDGRIAAIAAASIIAKVERDRFMAAQEKLFPHFSFSQHKGYGTKRHLEELDKYGPTILHRRSFAPVRDCLARRTSLAS